MSVVTGAFPVSPLTNTSKGMLFFILLLSGFIGHYSRLLPDRQSRRKQAILCLCTGYGRGRSPRGDGGADKNLDTMIPDTLVRTDEVHQGADYRRTDII